MRGSNVLLSRSLNRAGRGRILDPTRRKTTPKRAGQSTPETIARNQFATELIEQVGIPFSQPLHMAVVESLRLLEREQGSRSKAYEGFWRRPRSCNRTGKDSARGGTATQTGADIYLSNQGDRRQKANGIA